MKTIMHEGKEWKISAVGATRDGMTYVHLQSTNLGKWQKNGFYPMQIADWLPEEIVKTALTA